MVNILLEGYNIGASWLYDPLKKYLRPHSKVAVIAFSFRDTRVKSAEEWKMLYGADNGVYYKGITDAFLIYGIEAQNITFINYFSDTKEYAHRIVRTADIVYFLGGLPDRMMDRILDFELCDALKQHQGVIMGYSAGAVIQLSEYHLSPDDDYPQFGYYNGLSYLDGFYLEVHYENNSVQNETIKRVIREREKTVYATHSGTGALISDNGRIHILGNVSVFDKEHLPD